MFLQDLKRVLKANLLPALALQCLAVFLFWAYYYWPEGRHALESLAVFKKSTGLAYAFVASALSGAVLPCCFQGLQRGTHRRLGLVAVVALTVYYGTRGWLIDGFYVLQTHLWGDKPDAFTVAIKIVCDLGLFSPTLAVPSVVLMYGWVDAGFNWKRYKTQFEGRWYRDKVVPTLYMAWLVWLPVLCVLYALPSSLQFVVVMIVQCFWALLLVVLTDRGENEKVQQAKCRQKAAVVAEPS